MAPSNKAPRTTSSKDIPIISSLQASRALRHGASGYLALVRTAEAATAETATAETTTAETTTVTPAPQTSDSRLQEVLNRHQGVFQPLPCKLPPKRDVDHHIDLEPGGAQPYQGIYRMSPLELGELRKQLDDLLEKGFIKPSKSPFGAPILFVHKKDSGYLALVRTAEAATAETATAETTTAETTTVTPAPQTSDSRLQEVLNRHQGVFQPLPCKLPPKRDVDHHIDLEPGGAQPYQGIYRMSPLELGELRKQLDDLLEKGFIKPSKSPFGAPILFVHKKDGQPVEWMPAVC